MSVTDGYSIEKKVKTKKKKDLIALRDFSFSFNGKSYFIKKGDKIKVPEMFLQNLKTEKVIKD